MRRRLLQFAQGQPLIFKTILLIAGGVWAVVAHSRGWLLYPPADPRWLGLMFLFSVVVYAMFFVIYALLRVPLRLLSRLPEEIRQFDDRLLVRWMGLYGIFAYGLLRGVLEGFTTGSSWMFMLQGLAIAAGTGLAQKIKS